MRTLLILMLLFGGARLALPQPKEVPPMPIGNYIQSHI
jgi:hypothetical protein